ncbi:MAG: DUF1127 domain-containing protein [Pseudomonadota bacterium]
MTTFTSTIASGSGPFGLLLNALVGARQAAQEKRDIAQLEALSDHLLEDIGLERKGLRPRAITEWSEREAMRQRLPF